MTTSLDTLIVPVRYYSALDPYNWKVDNRPLSDLDDNDDVLRSGIETCLNAAKVGAAVDGRLLKALVGPYNAVGYWEPSASGVALEIYNTIKVSTVTDDSHDVDLIAIQYSPAVFALPTPSSGNKVLATIYARYELPSTPEMPYYDSTQALDALGTTVETLQTKQGNIEFAIDTVTVADTDPDNYPSPALWYDTLFNIKVDSTDTVLDPDKVIAVGISPLGQATAKATQTSYGQVRFATATEVTTGTSTDTVVSPADLKNQTGGNATLPDATTTTKGKVRFATATEVEEGTSTDTVVSPADLKNQTGGNATGFLTLVRAKAHAIDEVLTNLSIPTDTDVDSITQVGVHYLNNDTGITNLPRLAGFGSSLRVTEATTVTATSGIIYQEVTSPGAPWYKAFRSGVKQHVVGTFNDYAFHWTDWIYAVNPAHSVGSVGNTAGPSNYLTNVQVEDFILNSFINVDTSLVVTSGHTFYEVNFHVNTLQDAPDGSVVHIRLAPPASPGFLTPVRITSNLMSPSNTIEITDVNQTVSVMKYSIFGSAAFIFRGQGNII